MGKFKSRFLEKPALPVVVSLSGIIFYLVSAIQNAIYRTTFLDEGLYLVKGYLFAGNIYRPFAEFGPWTNQMPLSYYIPGFIQTIFGPGLRTGRYFSIFLGCLFLVAVWILVNRFSGGWWSAAAIWAIALNTATIKIYTLAISEVIIACLLVWCLVFLLGENRSTWMIVLGSAMAMLIFFVRINMAPFVLIIIAFVFWQHGKTKGILSITAASVVFIVINFLFFPGILKTWATWLPANLTPFLDSFRLTEQVGKWGESAGNSNIFERGLYFFLSFRLHFISLFGAICVWILWPGQKTNWANQESFKPAVFLSLTLVMLSIMHFFYSFFYGFCVSCILLYITFFDFLGILLVAISFKSLRTRLPAWRGILAILIFILFGFGIAYSANEEITRSTIQSIARIYDWNLNEIPFWDVFIKNGFENYPIYQIRSALIIADKALVLILLTAFLASLLLNRFKPGKYGYSYILFSITLVAGFILTPTFFLSKGNDFFSCDSDVLTGFESTAKDIQEIIAPGSRIWWVGRIPAIFLYLTDMEIFPQQLNHFHNLRTGAADEELARFGLWSQNLGLKWLEASDYVLVERQWLTGWVEQAIISADFVQLPGISIPEKCRPDSEILIFTRRND